MDFCTIISDSRAQQFPWKFIATHALRKFYFIFNKNDSWLSCLVLLQVHDLTGALFCASTSPWWCPNAAVVMTCYGPLSPHASMQPCQFACCCCRFIILMSAALLYCLVLWQACGQGKADSELYFWSIVGTCVYAMWTQMIDLIWMFFAKQLFISGYEGLLWCL